jgi:fructose-bisphosphate aldolase class II
VHLDHATNDEQLELAVGMAERGIKFDSIMVDASHADVCLARIILRMPS